MMKTVDLYDVVLDSESGGRARHYRITMPELERGLAPVCGFCAEKNDGEA